MSERAANEGAAPAHGRAVVVGAGIAGILAARALARYFREVVLIERDACAEDEGLRPGAPQARHLHLLLKRGLMVMEEQFPGLTADLLAAGCLRIDQGRDFRIMYRSGWAPNDVCGLDVSTCTRSLLEATLRRHLLAQPRVQFRAGMEVKGLELDAKGKRVAGVRLRRRPSPPGEAAELLAADLVVDAGGRNSHAPEWLEDVGFPAPRETSVDAFWGYATRLYEPAAGLEADWKILLLMNRPPDQPRAGIIQWVEGNRWIVTLAGVMKEYPPTDEQGFLDYARCLRSPALYEAIKDAKPLSPIWGYRRTANRLRSFESLRRRPEGFLAIGDSVCAFNPVYGQVMTLAALSAAALDRTLAAWGRRSLDGLARHFQRRLARVNSSAWTLATGEDLRWPSTLGGRITPKTRFLHWYIEQVIQLIPDNVEVYHRFQEVNHMLKQAGALFHPAVLLPILRRCMGSPRLRAGAALPEQPDEAIG
jgi:2-polyprenyl-6-methoxyphenol hydroxylase-like FAD-dependent oxidoreductase